jgi:hypothetical protein
LGVLYTVGNIISKHFQWLPYIIYSDEIPMNIQCKSHESIKQTRVWVWTLTFLRVIEKYKILP